MLKEEAILIEGLIDYYKILSNAILRQKEITCIKVRWKKPKTESKKNYIFLGVEETDPVDYMKRYGPTLIKNASEYLPELENNFPVPVGETLAVNCNRNISYTGSNISKKYSPRMCDLNQFIKSEDYPGNYLKNEYNSNFYSPYNHYNVYGQY